MGERELTRRQLLERGAAAGLTIAVGSSLLAACGGTSTSGSASPAAEKVTLTFATYGGPYEEGQKKAWLDPYMKLHPNVTIVTDGPVDYAKIKAMVEANNVTWDVVDVGGDFGGQADSAILTPIDTSIVPAWKTPLPGVQNTTWRVGEQTGAYIIAYWSTEYPNPPQNWVDFYDLKKFPGKRMHWKFVASGALESALVADGVPSDSLYPLDVDRALKKLTTIKKDIIWWETGAQSTQLLSDGEVKLGATWNGRSHAAKTAGKPVETQWNEEIMFRDFLVVPKGAKNVKAAMELIAYITAPENNAQLSYYYDNGPTTAGAENKIDPANKENLPTPYASTGINQDDAWWSENFASANKKFQTWLQA